MTERTAVVTGAASGIGLALAGQLAAEGYHVHLTDIVDTQQLATAISGTPHVLDVGDDAAMEALADAAPRASVVCLNAGIVGQTFGAPWEVPPREWEGLLKVNLLGVVNGLRAFVPRLLIADQPAHILITASLAGLLTFPGGGAYGATKHALVAVAEQTAVALEHSRISVTLLCPALVKSGMSDEGEDPNDVAAAGLGAARRNEFVVMPPEWRSAVRNRGNILSAGHTPEIPSPD